MKTRPPMSMLLSEPGRAVLSFADFSWRARSIRRVRWKCSWGRAALNFGTPSTGTSDPPPSRRFCIRSNAAHAGLFPVRVLRVPDQQENHHSPCLEIETAIALSFNYARAGRYDTAII